MKLALTVLFLFVGLTAYTQTETFDIITYTAPSGWTKDAKDFAVSYSTVDQVAATWCQMAIYKSVPSSGDPATDFRSEWKALVNTATYVGATEPAPQKTVEDGWTIHAGASAFKWQDKDSQLLLMNVSGYGTMLSIFVSMNSDRYMKDIEKFLESINLKKPEQTVVSQQPVQAQSQPLQATVQPAPTTGAPIVVTNAAGVSGISTSTTNFDDGWVAQPFADYVKVVKQPITVLLHYSFQTDDEMRQGDLPTVVWNRLMVPRYNLSNVKVFQNEPFTYNRIYFMEGDAVELSTGKASYVGLRVLVWSGIVHCIEIIAPSMAALQKEFPNQEKIEKMTGYNKFFVVAGDISGTWEESSSTGINLYNSVTGAYAGMNASSSAHTFTFNGDGTYNSNHKGAYGMVGSMNFYDQKYKGKVTVGSWDMTLTNRWEGKTEVFWCEFEAVRGGRMLKLRDKSANGITYNLVKTK